MNEILCPQCGAPIAQDFGVVTCASCGTVLMVDFEGHIQRMESASVLELVPEFEAPAEVQSISPEQAPSEEYQDIYAIPDPPRDAPPANNQSSSIEDAIADIQDFANAELPTTPLSYTLIVEGIDRGELRQQLSVVMADEKLKLNVVELMKSIKAGRLELENLNAVKASLLVLRLRQLPLRISWRQHAYQS